MDIRVARLLDSLSERQKELLQRHLRNRCTVENKTGEFRVVFDLLHQCDINCLGCGTNAQFVGERKVEPKQMTLAQVKTVLKKIRDYADEEKLTPFINFGGGEPFLRTDIMEVLKLSSEMFGPSHVGIDTNASLEWSYDSIKEAMEYVSYVGVSINGLHDYHNWWANNGSIDAFARATAVVEQLCHVDSFAQKLEVTTVATRKNYASIPDLMCLLKGIGVQHFSVHRAIPVGRMAHLQEDLKPSSEEYLQLLCSIVESAEKLGLNAHLHHSIEAIYGTLLCGINTYFAKNIVDTNYRSSIAVDPSGSVYPNPWCTTGFWREMSFGNILENVTLRSLFINNERLLEDMRASCSFERRCHGCSLPCSGGSRIVAAAGTLNHYRHTDVTREDILNAMLSIDPACPLAEMR